ncbi:hypothetical protein [Streptomyces sp. MA5143a]|uniref:hypothetical protein n=1 Tax=Streptomyces sp. MA5143a TaxID=2083010 RepID=UPI0015E7781C|nr:hypothetical protein [Streptomyces sp. MA5143a]
MTAVLPRTIRVVDTDHLLLLQREAARLGFSQRLPAERDGEGGHRCPYEAGAQREGNLV